ncbi:hypothetical protein [uncultured Eubacterium sp.]|uniref:hypothetical protein n=1 Tax=uncultured Eubacterium sp. TaxID=165185 RepID=UPI0025936578|nr:hypothetical protein [uncultured Eubacterium sp.]
MEEQQKEVRNLVLAGLENIKEGKTKDFNEVCDRLEKKYRVVPYIVVQLFFVQ